MLVNGPLVTNDAEALLHGAVAGLGVMMVADWLVARQLAEGRLVRVLPKWTMLDRGAIYAVVPSGRLLPRKTRAFIDWVSALLAPTPPWRRKR